MVKYVKLFLATHVKYWYIYMVVVVFTFISVLVTVFSALYSVNTFDSYKSAHIFTTLVFTVISSAPLIIPNFMVAKKSHISTNNVVVIILTLGNQIVFILPIFIVVYKFLEGFVSEFN